MKKRIVFLISLFFLCSVSLMAQVLIKGKIVDESNMEIPGANVIVKGTTIGTITDLDGNYSLEVPSDTVTLKILYIGCESLEVPLNGNRTMNASLTEDRRELEEIVIMGYGTRKSSGCVGSVSGIKKRTTKRSKTDVYTPPSVKIKATDTDTETSTSINKKNKAGTLTAGEIEDLPNWKEWTKTIKKYSQMPDYWNYNVNNKIGITVKSKQNKLLNNINVTLLNQKDEIIWQTKTDNRGRAELFSALHKPNQLALFKIKLSQIGENDKIIENIELRKSNYIFKYDIKSVYSNNIDVMFVVDATGSMGDEMEFLKVEMNDIISRVEKGNQNTEIRIGLTFYRDAGEEYVVRNFGFDKDRVSVLKNISNQYADGGGDTPEAVDQALENAILQQSWNKKAHARLLFLVLDAPPHTDSQSISRIHKATEAAARKGIKLIPVVASGIDKNTEFLMRFMAIATNGTYVFLTDDSGVGGTHLKPSTDDYKVEMLNDLIVRLILKYTEQIQSIVQR